MFAELKNMCKNCNLLAGLKEVASKETSRLSDVTDRIPSVDLPQDWSVKKVGKWADQHVSDAVKGIKNTNLPDKVQGMMPTPAKKITKPTTFPIKTILVLGMVAVAVVGLVIYISRKLNENATDDFNDFNYTVDTHGDDDQTFDFDHASLDELEAALLRVESDLDEVSNNLTD